MHRGETTEAAEVCNVQSEYVAYAMDVHRCRQPCVVNLNTQDPVLKDNPPPFPVDGLAVRQQDHTALDDSHLALGFGYR